MNGLKIGDRVRVIIALTIDGTNKVKVAKGMIGNVKELNNIYSGVEFDDYIGGHNGVWNGKDGHCWYVDNEYLEKIEDTEEEIKEEVNEEIKTEALEQKILTALREEIGVDIGEEFDVYENGEKQWTCKFDEVGFSHEIDDEFRESGLWKQIVCKFHSYQFKKKPFVPKYGEDYFFLTINNRCNDNKNIFFGVKTDTWVGVGIDYGRLALRNVFKSSSEALENRDKLKERLNELRRGE